MKIFHKGKLVSPYRKGRKMKGLAKNNRLLITQYKFDNSLYDLIPEFNEGFTYTYEDVVEGKVTTRTIISTSLPTLMRFGKMPDGVADGNLVDNRTKSLSKILFINTSNLTDMSYMFYDCRSLTTLDVSNWDTSNVTNIKHMFHNCHSLTSIGDLSNWDTSNVTEMHEMFRECYSLKEIKGLNNWDISSVENSMYCMFYYAKSLEELDLSNWDVSNITDMRWLFSDCTALKTLNISNWSINNEVITTEMLLPYYESEMTINKIIMNYSDYNSVNKIIAELPTRTSDSISTLNILGVDDIIQVDTDTLNSKYWTIISHTILNNAILGQTKLN